jgi:hypothetical protein
MGLDLNGWPNVVAGGDLQVSDSTPYSVTLSWPTKTKNGGEDGSSEIFAADSSTCTTKVG